MRNREILLLCPPASRRSSVPLRRRTCRASRRWRFARLRPVPGISGGEDARRGAIRHQRFRSGRLGGAVGCAAGTGRDRCGAAEDAAAGRAAAARRVPPCVFDDGRFGTTASPEAARLTTALAAWSGLRREPRGGQYEFWVIRRRASGHTVLGTKLGHGGPQPPRGSLRPEIAAALVRTVPLSQADIVLDPFAGSGAIGIAALGAGAGRVWLNDLSPGPPGLIRRLPGAVRRRVHHTHMDFRLLPQASGPAVTTVITDPPWGLFKETTEPIEAFYSELAAAMARMLKAGHSMIVLTGAPSAAEASLTTSGRFAVADSVAVLMNGKKARVVCGRRTSACPPWPAPPAARSPHLA